MSELCWFGVWFSVRDQSSLRMMVRNGVSLLLLKGKQCVMAICCACGIHFVKRQTCTLPTPKAECDQGTRVHPLAACWCTVVVLHVP